MTYAEWYLEGLYAQLELGGAEADVDRLVNEINRPTVDGLAWFLRIRRHASPKHGFIGLIGDCGTCGEDFAIPDPTPQLDQEVLCPKCMTQAINRDPA